MTKFVYLASYQLAFVLFVLISWALLAPSRARYRNTLMLALAYLGGMFYAAHGLFYIATQRSLTNGGADKFWSWLADKEISSLAGAGAVVWRLFESSGGLWGGPLVVLALVLVLLVLVRMPIADKGAIADACAVALPFSLALCKVGCFAVGCCHGVEGWGPLFFGRIGGLGSDGASCFPTQLLDLTNYLLIGAVLLALHRRGKARGLLILWFVVLFAVVRFGSEFTRGDTLTRGTSVLGLSLVQLALLAGAAVTIPLLLGPRLFHALLAARRPAENGAAPTADDRRSKRYLVILVVTNILLLHVFLLPIFAIFLTADLLGSRDPSKVAHHGACFAIGALWLTAFMVPSLIPFLAVAAVSTVGVPLLFDRVVLSRAP